MSRGWNQMSRRRHDDSETGPSGTTSALAGKKIMAPAAKTSREQVTLSLFSFSSSTDDRNVRFQFTGNWRIRGKNRFSHCFIFLIEQHWHRGGQTVLRGTTCRLNCKRNTYTHFLSSGALISRGGKMKLCHSAVMREGCGGRGRG